MRDSAAQRVKPRGGADRLRAWLAELPGGRDILAISHGLTLRVLRGLLCGGPPVNGVNVADDVPQGTAFEVCDGVEALLNAG